MWLIVYRLISSHVCLCINNQVHTIVHFKISILLMRHDIGTEVSPYITQYFGYFKNNMEINFHTEIKKHA